MTDETLDHPFYEVTAQAEALAAKGAYCFQKFTCAGCGNRLTMEEPNRFYTTGSCDRCGHVTDIVADGCNFLLIWPTDPAIQQAALRAVHDAIKRSK